MRTIFPIKAFTDNYIWCLQEDTENFVIIIDPGDCAPVFKYLQQSGLTLLGILVTHHHWDHTNGIKKIIEQYPVNVYGSVKTSCPWVNIFLEEGMLLKLPELNTIFSILEIPGHTLDHLVFYDNKFAFVGDTLFSAGCGRVFEGSMEQMYHSLEKISSLPEHIKLYCGHEYTVANLKFAREVEPENLQISKKLEESKRQRITLPTTLRAEKNINPFLRCDKNSVIESVKKYATEHQLQLNADEPTSVFKVLRQWKDHYKAEV